MGTENRLLGWSRPVKLWGNSNCKGLVAAASLAGGGTDRKLVGLEWPELGGRRVVRLETEGVSRSRSCVS